MSRRGENIYKRKDQRWEGRYMKSRKPSGRIHYGYVYGRSYKETKEKLILKKFEFREVQSSKNENCLALTLRQWSRQCLSEWKDSIKVSSYNTYNYKLSTYVLPYIGEQRINEVKPMIIKQLVNKWLEIKLSHRMIHLLFQLVRRLFTSAMKKNLITQNPCMDIVLPKQEFKKITPLSLTEQRRLEKIANAEKNGDLIIIALHLGLRIGEISALKWENIDFEKNRLYVTETCQRLNPSSSRTTLAMGPVKTASSNRTIPLTDPMSSLLLKRKKNNLSPFVFQVKGKPMEPRLITYYFHKIRKKAELPEIHFHQLRHSFATRLLESKVTITSISELLGHRSTQMTLDIYTGTVFEDKYLSLKKMEEVM